MKYLFIDMDGTINSWVNMKGGVIINDFNQSGIFINKRPLYIVLKSILELFPPNLYQYHILSASPNDKANEEKDIWLDVYFPVKEVNRHYLKFPGEDKTLFIKEFCKNNNINISDCIIIDDTHSHLLKAEENGIKAIHPATLITWYEELKENEMEENKSFIKRIKRKLRK